MKNFASLLLTVLSLTASAQEMTTHSQYSEGYTLTLTEELRFGSVEEDDVYLWTGLQTKILPAPNGGMYIFDQQASRALLFDRDGVFVKQVARKGEGPGELQYINTVSRAANGSIYVVDTPSPGNAISIKRFNADMTFRDEIKTTSMPFRPDNLTISPDEAYMAGLFITFHPETGGLAHKTGVLRMKDHGMANDFHNALVPLPSLSISNQNTWIDIIARGTRHRFHQGLIAMGSDGTIYTALSNDYKISYWKPGAEKPHTVVKHTYSPKVFTEQDLNELVEHMYLNMDEQAKRVIGRTAVEKGFAAADLVVHPPLLNLIPLEDKGVIAVREADSTTLRNRGDVFSRDGRFLCSVEVPNGGLSITTPGRITPFERITFHEGKAYTIITDEDGEHRAVRYSYTLQN